MNRTRVTGAANRARTAGISVIATSPAIVRRTPARGVSVIAASAFIVMGCVVESAALPPPLGIAVGSPPPEPMQEIRPPPPQNAPAIWIAGYWHWTGVQYAWIPGHWENPPPGTRWRAPHYLLRDGTYFYEPGGWTRR